MSERIFNAYWFNEHDQGTVDVEELYQAFKARLMREVVAQIRHRSISGCESFTENIELVALRSGERENNT